MCTSIIVKILWNLLCQYKNIYTSLHKYLKGKKKKKTIAIVAIVPLGIVVTDQDLRKKKMWLTKPKHCCYNDLAHSLFYIYKFIFSCGWSQFHILLFYFELLEIDTSIIVKILWNLLRQYIYIYIKGKKIQMEDWKNKRKKTIATVATGPLAIVVTVQKF